MLVLFAVSRIGTGDATAKRRAADGYVVGNPSPYTKSEALVEEPGGVGVTGSNRKCPTRAHLFAD